MLYQTPSSRKSVNLSVLQFKQGLVQDSSKTVSYLIELSSTNDLDLQKTADLTPIQPPEIKISSVLASELLYSAAHMVRRSKAVVSNSNTQGTKMQDSHKVAGQH